MRRSNSGVSVERNGSGSSKIKASERASRGIVVSLLGLFSVAQVYWSTADHTLPNTRQHLLEAFVSSSSSRMTTGTASNYTASPSDAKQELLALFSSQGEPLTGEERRSIETLDWKYGPPRVYGMETCESFRQKVPLRQRVVAVAGLFNTGTNAMDSHLKFNVKGGVQHKWQVPWGKHRMESVRETHVANRLGNVNKDHVLPVVMIRDPFYWMQSMCKSPYAVKWRKSKLHCPNLVMTEHDHKAFRKLDNFTIKVIFDKDQIMFWDSLVHLYSDWYRQYINVTDYPRIIVRFEDMLLHPRWVMQHVADCVGAQLPKNFQVNTDSAKKHGSHTNLLQAILKTTDPNKRVRQLTLEDLDYARMHLDSEILEMFGYDLPTAVAQ